MSIPETSLALTTVLSWADDVRRLDVRANADTAADATAAIALGAHGVGLCRTEHQFLGDRLPLIRRVVLAPDADAETKALAALADAQREDFRDLLRAVGDRPVTIRLLDAPMHEFLPTPADAEDEHQARLVEQLREVNPMLADIGMLTPHPARLPSGVTTVAEAEAGAVEAPAMVGRPGGPLLDLQSVDESLGLLSFAFGLGSDVIDGGYANSS